MCQNLLLQVHTYLIQVWHADSCLEIELIEPSLFLDHESVGKRGTEALCDQILKR